MKVFDTCIYDFSGQKNLGRAYNEAMANAPEDSHVILRDGDTCWLTPDYGIHVSEYIRRYPNAVLTCWTNRINAKAEQQAPGLRDCHDMLELLRAAEEYKSSLYRTTPIHGFVSGFCLILPKNLWHQHKFSEVQVYSDRGPTNMLGVDNDWTNRVRAAGTPVLNMDGVLLFHIYRMLKGDQDKSHLL